MSLAFYFLLRIVTFVYAIAGINCTQFPVNRSLSKNCRNLPGDPNFPSSYEWAKLNESVDGRLLQVVPSAKYCHKLPAGNCTENEWTSTLFRGDIPGAMDIYNWEQDYTSNPPSLCLQNGTECGQGNVPVIAINASEAKHIQAGVRFASQYNVKIAIKSSGHDLLGRSTAKGSLLLWTHYLRNITFSDAFFVGGKNLGSAVTVGSGMPLNILYNVTRDAGKFFVGGVAPTVAAAGGYIQGGGHSSMSPAFGLASDNALEFKVVTANGDLVTANEAENPDLFWALRGGGAGSWGVIISATLRTFPIFNATEHDAIITFPISKVADMMSLHAKHIFDWDDRRAGQYFFALNGASFGINISVLTLSTYFVNASASEATNAMAPLLDEARRLGFSVLGLQTNTGLINDLLYQSDTQLGINQISGSRLIPATAYKDDPDAIGSGYERLFDLGAPLVFGTLVAGGKVSENAVIDSAVTPKWRTAKAHVVVAQNWPDTFSPAQVEAAKQELTNSWVPVLEVMTGEKNSGSYSNEADVREPDFQQTFFGPNYSRLKAIKQKYDPNGMFIVGAGVGSEDWDAEGICHV